MEKIAVKKSPGKKLQGRVTGFGIWKRGRPFVRLENLLEGKCRRL